MKNRSGAGLLAEMIVRHLEVQLVLEPSTQKHDAPLIERNTHRYSWYLNLLPSCVARRAMKNTEPPWEAAM